MRTKQTWLRSRGRLWQVGVAIAVVMLAGAPLQRAFAAGGPAGFAFADNNSAFNVGSVIDVELLESGTNVQTVWANLSYPTSLLQFQQASFDNSLNTVAAGGVDCSADPASDNGLVSLRCTALTPPNGTEIVADLRFVVLAPGTATLSMVAGNNSATDIDDTTGASIWDGALPHVTYTLKGRAAGGSSRTTPSGGPVSGSTTPSSGSTPTGGNPTPGGSTPTPQGPGGTLRFSVSDAFGRPLGGARVTVNDSTVHYTDTDGNTGFDLTAGTYVINVTAPGMVPQNVQTTLGSSSKRLSLQLSPAAPGAALGLFALVLLAAYFGRSRWLGLFLRLPVKLPQSAGVAPAAGIVVGDGGLALTPEGTPVGVTPPQPGRPPGPPPAMPTRAPMPPPGSFPPYPSYPAQAGQPPAAQAQYPPQYPYPGQPQATPRPGGGYTAPR